MIRKFKKGELLTTSDINRYFSIGVLDGNEEWAFENKSLSTQASPLDDIKKKAKYLDKCCKDEKFRHDEMKKARSHNSQKNQSAKNTKNNPCYKCGATDGKCMDALFG